MRKSVTIFSELKEYFRQDDSHRAINHIANIMDSLRLRESYICKPKAANRKYSVPRVFQLLMLFPLFEVKDAFHYSVSALGRLFNCQKDMFYRFMRNDSVDWRAYCTSSTASSSKGFPCVPTPGRGKCETGDFTEQIASISLTVLQYNILTLVKRFDSYETIGGLFGDVVSGTKEFSITDKIWGLIEEVVAEISETVSVDFTELITHIIHSNMRINKVFAKEYAYLITS